MFDRSKYTTFRRIEAEQELKELKRQHNDFQSKMENERQKPHSEYDNLINEQQDFNDSIATQVCEKNSSYN